MSGIRNCPRCGAEATREVIDYERNDKYVQGKRVHEGRISCTECGYHTDWFGFQDHWHNGSNLGLSDDDLWAYAEAEWTRLTLNYAKNKAYRVGLDKRRCVCGKVPRKGWNFCPNCGKEVRDEG